MSRQRIEQWLETCQAAKSSPSDASKRSSHHSSGPPRTSRLPNASHGQSSSSIWSGTKGTGDRKPGRAPRRKYRGHVCGFCSRPDIDKEIEAQLKTDGHSPNPLFGLEPGGASQIRVSLGHCEAVGTVSSNGGARVSIKDQPFERTTARFEGFWNGQHVVLVNTTNLQEQLTLDLPPTHDLTSGYPVCPLWAPDVEYSWTFEISQGSRLPERLPKHSRTTCHETCVVTVTVKEGIYNASIALPGIDIDAPAAEWKLLPQEWERLPEQATSFSSPGPLQFKLSGVIYGWSTRSDEYYHVDCPQLEPTLIKVEERITRPSRYTKDFSWRSQELSDRLR